MYIYLQTKITWCTVGLFKTVSLMLSICVVANIKAIKHVVDHLDKPGSTLHAWFLGIGGLPHPVGECVSNCATHDLYRV